MGRASLLLQLIMTYPLCQVTDMTKLYMQIYDTISRGILSNPKQQCHKLVETIFHMYEKMELFSLVR